MKTKPNDNILPIQMTLEEQRVMNIYYEAVHEIVCYGTTILAGSLTQNKKKLATSQPFLAVPLLFRHILELLDGISVQLKSGIIMPCKVQLRAVLEAYLSLEYLLIENTEERAACLFIVDYYRQLNQYKKHIPNTPENAAYLKELEKYNLDYGDIVTVEHASSACEDLERLINKPQYFAAKEEYLRYTKQNTKNLNNLKWYALHGGPTSLHGLAVELKLLELYDSFYRSWSNNTHGTELWSGTLSVDRDGKGQINQIRNLQESQMTTKMSVILGLYAFATLGHKVIPKEKGNIAKWTYLFRGSHNTAVDKNELIFDDLIYFRV